MFSTHLFLFCPLVDPLMLSFPPLSLISLCFKKKRTCLSKPAFYSRTLTYNTRSMLHSAESKVFMIIPVSSKRQQKQCQDQFVNKTRSHPLCYFFCFVFVFMDEYIKTCMILLLWDTNIFSLGFSFPRF